MDLMGEGFREPGNEPKTFKTLNQILSHRKRLICLNLLGSRKILAADFSSSSELLCVEIDIDNFNQSTPLSGEK